MMMNHQTKLGCQRINSLGNIVESHILIKWALTVTFTLKIAETNQQKILHDIPAHDAASS